MEKKETYTSLEDQLAKLEARFVSSWRNHILAVIILGILGVWTFLMDYQIFAVTCIFLGIITLFFSIRPSSILSNLTELKKSILRMKVSFIPNISLSLLNYAPEGSTKLVLMKAEEDPVQIYRPIQWWNDQRMMVGVGKEPYEDWPLFRDFIEPFIVSEDWDRVTISLDTMRKFLEFMNLTEEQYESFDPEEAKEAMQRLKSSSKMLNRLNLDPTEEPKTEES